MAVAYVFLQLIPELDEGHALLGRMIFVIPLAAFVLFYGIDKLIVYGIPTVAAEAGWRGVPQILALGLHVVHCDFSTGRDNPKAFDRVGRYVLAPAPIVAWVMIVTVETSDSVRDIFVAILAGTLLHQVFAEELPEGRESRYVWFVAGVAVFSVVAACTW